MAFLASLIPGLLNVIPGVINSLVGRGLIGGSDAGLAEQMLLEEIQTNRPGTIMNLVDTYLPENVGGALLGGRRRKKRKGTRKSTKKGTKKSTKKRGGALIGGKKKKKGLTPYNKFVSQKRKAGYSMKEIGRMWSGKGSRKGSRKVSRPRRGRASASTGRSRSAPRRRDMEDLYYANQLGLEDAAEEVKELKERSERPLATLRRKERKALRNMEFVDEDLALEQEARSRKANALRKEMAKSYREGDLDRANELAGLARTQLQSDLGGEAGIKSLASRRSGLSSFL
jgi:hypothetical protein